MKVSTISLGQVMSKFVYNNKANREQRNEDLNNTTETIFTHFKVHFFFNKKQNVSLKQNIFH